jgi:hypothetical protein
VLGQKPIYEFVSATATEFAVSATVKRRVSLGGIVSSLVFALLILFIQEGASYYASVQTVALIFLVAIILHSGVVLRLTPLVIAVFTLFSAQLAITAVLLPQTISTNSPNILLTMIGVQIYVAGMLAMVCFRSVRPRQLLRFFQRTSAMFIVIVVALVVVTDLGLVPAMTREYFILQNVGLVTNYTTLSVLLPDFAARKARGELPDIDLFYGEQSFLSLVIFACLVCQVITVSAENYPMSSIARHCDRSASWKKPFFLWICGIGCMLYIHSFSSLFYAAIMGVFLLVNAPARVGIVRLTPARACGFALVGGAGLLIAMEALPYYLHRITTFSDSISAQQRFGSILKFLPQDYVFGLLDADRLPGFGFHNGAIYLVMMAGAGGAAVIAFLLWRIAVMARPLRLVGLGMLAMLAVFSQSGGVLSPNKLVIISLFFVPLTTFFSLLLGEAESIQEHQET